MYTLNETPIRWFPEDWSLKERKHRERFCLVWKNCPEFQHTQRLVNRNLQSDFLAKYSIKAYKAIHTPKGERQLIVFFERHTDMLFALRTSFNIDNSEPNQKSQKQTVQGFYQRLQHTSGPIEKVGILILTNQIFEEIREDRGFSRTGPKHVARTDDIFQPFRPIRGRSSSTPHNQIKN
ncbi:hypothetical protein RclHR1_07410002 [Rhizophagus clarus]|uniref:Uncharacterized protein n=1 Tax=Rhizophagus clarus TaxID=94130 RepID=A0A2Z6RWP4_9GLOM|nr:hypothetical protein RclHR1_07410002 [Rhizophagus clarus]